MRTIFIWDIHWCFDEFLLLLKKLNYSEKDNLYLVWDLLNKGPKAKELIDWLINNPNVKSVLWNNEVNFLRFAYQEKALENAFTDKNKENVDFLIKKWLFDKTYNKYNPLFEKYLNVFYDYHLEYLLSLPLWIETQQWILLHWWLVPNKKLEDHKIDEITRIRDYDWKPWYEFYNWEKIIIYGHWAVDWLRIRQKTKWLDSWCVYWKRLTAYIFETNEIIQVSSLRPYLPI